jgi:membrane-associated protein
MDASGRVGTVIDVVDAVARATGPLLWLLVGALAFAETALFADLVVPGEVGMVLAGAAGARGDGNFVALVGAGVVGAVLGDSCSYALGARYGTGMVHRWRFVRRRLEPKLDAAHAYFERRGAAAVFLGRWVGALRAVVPFVAGTAGMGFPRFLAWNLLASLGWVTTTVGLGWFVGEPAARAVDRVGLAVSVAVVAVAALAWLWHRHRRR